MSLSLTVLGVYFYIISQRHLNIPKPTAIPVPTSNFSTALPPVTQSKHFTLNVSKIND